MRKTKLCFMLFFVTFMVLSSGCGKKDSEDATAPSTTPAEETPTTLIVTVPVTPPIVCSSANIRCVDDTLGPQQEYSTIQAASDATVPGDTVLVFDGNYNGFKVNISGTSSNRITYRSVNIQGAIISNLGPIAGANTGDGIRIQNSSNITIDGFKIINVVARGIAARGALATSPMTGITIRNVDCRSSVDEGFYLSQVSNSLIEGNTISHAGQGSNVLTQHDLYLANAGSDNITIRNNIFNGMGLHFNGDRSIGGDGIISGILLEGNVITVGVSPTGNGVSMDGVQNSTIQNNVIYNAPRTGIRAFKVDAAEGPKNINFINNTIFSQATSTGWNIKLSEDMGGHTFFNNILINESSNGSIMVGNTNFKSDYNAVVNRFSIDGMTTITLSQWQALGYDVGHSFISTKGALFVNPNAYDYHLLNTAPAIDTGTSALNVIFAPSFDKEGNVRAKGAGYDIGAYEYTMLTTPPITLIPEANGVVGVRIDDPAKSWTILFSTNGNQVAVSNT